MLCGLTEPLGVCSCLFLYSSDPNVNIQLQNTPVFTPAFIKSDVRGRKTIWWPRPGENCLVIGFFMQRAHKIVSWMRLLTVMNLFFMLCVCAFSSLFWCIFLVFNLLIEPFSGRNQTKSAPFQSTGKISHYWLFLFISWLLHPLQKIIYSFLLSNWCDVKCSYFVWITKHIKTKVQLKSLIITRISKKNFSKCLFKCSFTANRLLHHCFILHQSRDNRDRGIFSVRFYGYFFGWLLVIANFEFCT